jgi:hypothetical protein
VAAAGNYAQQKHKTHLCFRKMYGGLLAGPLMLIIVTGCTQLLPYQMQNTCPQTYKPRPSLKPTLQCFLINSSNPLHVLTLSCR